MVSKDITFCWDSDQGKCATRGCPRFITKSLKEAFQRQGLPMYVAEFWDDCRIKTEPEK